MGATVDRRLITCYAQDPEQAALQTRHLTSPKLQHLVAGEWSRRTSRHLLNRLHPDDAKARRDHDPNGTDQGQTSHAGRLLTGS